MPEPRFAGVLALQDGTVGASPDRCTLTVVFNAFTLPWDFPKHTPDEAKENQRSLLIVTDPLVAPATISAQLRGAWHAPPEDGVELIIDAPGVTITREDVREDFSFFSNFSFTLEAGAPEFSLTVKLRQASGDAPKPDQLPVTMDAIDFTISAAPN